MTQDEYNALDPRTKYQIEKERRAKKRDEITAAQLEEARILMIPDPSKGGKTRRKNV